MASGSAPFPLPPCGRGDAGARRRAGDGGMRPGAGQAAPDWGRARGRRRGFPGRGRRPSRRIQGDRRSGAGPGRGRRLGRGAGSLAAAAPLAGEAALRPARPLRGQTPCGQPGSAPESRRPRKGRRPVRPGGEGGGRAGQGAGAGVRLGREGGAALVRRGRRDGVRSGREEPRARGPGGSGRRSLPDRSGGFLGGDRRRARRRLQGPCEVRRRSGLETGTGAA